MFLDRFSDRQRDLLAFILLALTGGIAYANTFTVPWYFDDYLNIIENQSVHNLEGALGVLFRPRGPVLLSFALNYALNGESLPGYHLVNICIHIAAAMVVYLILKRVTGGSQGWSLMGALLFLCHPLQTQAVTYIVQRMSSLCGLFAFLTLYCFIKGKDAFGGGRSFFSAQHVLWYASMLIFCSLAVATKQNAAFLPIGLLLFDRLILSRDKDFDWIKSSAYLFPLVVPPLVIAVNILLIPLMGGASLAGIGSSHYDTSPFTYFVTQFSVLWIYIRLLFLPYGQNFDYFYPLAEKIITFSNVVALLGLAGLGVLAYRLRGTMSAVSFGICWFFAALAVESSFIPLDPLFEHRLYIPIFGFVVIVVHLLRQIHWRWLRVGAVIAMVMVYALLTIKRNALWNNPVAFYEDNLRKAPHNARIHVELARLYMQNKRYGEAQRLLHQALRLSPDSANVYTYMGTLYDLMGKPDDAIAAYRKAIRINPAYIKAYVELSVAYSNKGDFGIAEGLLRESILRNPDNAGAHYNLGVVLYKQNKKIAARDEFRTSLKYSPFDADALYNLGITSAETGNLDESRSVLERFQDLDPARGQDLATKIELLRRNSGR